MIIEKVINGKNRKCYVKNNDSKWTILFIHGFSSSNEFAKGLYNLENNYNIVSIDMIDYKSGEDATIKNFWEIADYFLKKVNTRKVIVLGHSLGGAVISKISDNRKVKRVVWMSTIHPKMTKTFGIKSLSDYLHGVDSKKGLLASKLKDITKLTIKYGGKSRLNKFLEKDSIWNPILTETLVDHKFMSWLDDQYHKLAPKSTYIIGKGDPLIKTKMFIEYVEELDSQAHLIGKEHNPIKTDPKGVNQLLNEMTEGKKRWFKRKVIK